MPAAAATAVTFMTVYALKPRFQQLLRPVAGRMAAAGITANQVTVAAAVGSVAVAALVVWSPERRWLFLLLPLWLFVRMMLNAIDGMLAREFGQQSRLGAYLNEICDVVSDAALYAPIALVAPFGPLGIALAIFLSALTELVGVLGQTIGASRRYDGPLGKSDRAVLFGTLAFWIGVGGALPGWLGWLVPLANLLLIWTVINRVRAGLREAESGGMR